MPARAMVRAAVLLAALALLTASLTFYDVWPTPKIQWFGHLSVEVAVALLILVVATRDGRVPAGVLRGLSMAWVALVVGRYFDVMAPALYGRPVNLYWDARHLSAVAAMMTDTVAGPLLLVGLVVIALVLWLAYKAARWAFASVAQALQWLFGRLGVAALGVVLAALYGAQVARGSDAPPFIFTPPVTATYWQQLRLVASQFTSAPPIVDASTPVVATDLAQVRGADVLLVFVESYGAVTLDRQPVAEPLAASRARFAADIAASGREVVSAMVESPTFGGSSWLAHVSLMTGVEARDEGANRVLMSQRRETIVSTFGQAGYRTVALMPGLRFAWPEGAFYGFDQIYDTTHLNYGGPRFGWWNVPDQFALAKLDAIEMATPERRPLFVFYPTTNTHAPFGPTAPYQPDWPRMLSDQPYAEPALGQALAREPDFLDLSPSYVNAVDYTLTTIGGYLRQHTGRDLVAIVIGDHQPAAMVSGEGASWDVPVHVITTRPDVLEALVARGFGRGITPQRQAIGAMHTLLPTLLASFSGSPTHVARQVAPAAAGAVREGLR